MIASKLPIGHGVLQSSEPDGAITHLTEEPHGVFDRAESPGHHLTMNSVSRLPSVAIVPRSESFPGSVVVAEITSHLFVVHTLPQEKIQTS